jgi:hypothetical protein
MNSSYQRPPIGLAFMHVHSMRITSGEETLVARALTTDGKVGFGFTFRLDAAEARHMAEWHAGVRKERPAYQPVVVHPCERAWLAGTQPDCSC